MTPPVPIKRGVATSRREFIVGGSLVASALASGLMAAGVTPDEVPDAILDREVPRTIGRWQLAPDNAIPIPQGEGGGEDVYDQLVSRHYASDVDLPVMLLVAYGAAQSGSTQLHRPEVCYPAAGFRLTDGSDVKLALDPRSSIPGRAMTALAPARVEQILYWSRIGDDFPTGSLRQRWSVLRQTITSGAPDGILVRLSTIHPDADTGQATLRRFARLLVDGGSSQLRQILVGGA